MSINSDKVLVSNNKIAYLHAKKSLIVCTWEINGITSFLKSTESVPNILCLSGPMIASTPKKQYSWYLILQISSVAKTSMSINLKGNYTGGPMQTTCLIFLENNKGERILKNFKAYNPSSNELSHQLFIHNNSNGYDVNIQDLLNKKDEFLQNDVLRVGVEIIVFNDNVEAKNVSTALTGFKRTLSDDLNKLIKAKKKYDVVIKVDDKNFDAHKLVLISRSSVFEDKFSHDKKKNKKKEIIISDITSEVFQRVIDYIYTDKVDDLETCAEELFDAAAKYKLQGLIEICEDHLSKTINHENAIKLLILAVRYSAKRLEEFAADFVAGNPEKFKDSIEFMNLETSHPAIFYGILKKRFGIAVQES